MTCNAQIVAEGEVGPYMYQVVVALESDANGDALFNWLTENNFDIPGKLVLSSVAFY
jgi:hypothetical protein